MQISLGVSIHWTGNTGLDYWTGLLDSVVWHIISCLAALEGTFGAFGVILQTLINWTCGSMQNPHTMNYA